MWIMAQFELLIFEWNLKLLSSPLLSSTSSLLKPFALPFCLRVIALSVALTVFEEGVLKLIAFNQAALCSSPTLCIVFELDLAVMAIAVSL